MTGTKHDQGKSRLELIDPDWLEDVGHVLAHGAKIHGDNNWKKVEQPRYIAAAMRHIMAIMRGEYLDPETQKPHAAHLACNAMFLHHLGGPNARNKRVRANRNPAKHDANPEQDSSSGVYCDDEATSSDP